MPSKPHPTDPNYEDEMIRQGYKPAPKKKQPAQKPATNKPSTEKK